MLYICQTTGQFAACNATSHRNRILSRQRSRVRYKPTGGIIRTGEESKGSSLMGWHVSGRIGRGSGQIKVLVQKYYLKERSLEQFCSDEHDGVIRDGTLQFVKKEEIDLSLRVFDSRFVSKIETVCYVSNANKCIFFIITRTRKRAPSQPNPYSTRFLPTNHHQHLPVVSLHYLIHCDC